MRWTLKDLMTPGEKTNGKTTSPKLGCGTVGTAQRQEGSMGKGNDSIGWHQDWIRDFLEEALMFELDSQGQRKRAVEIIAAEWPKSL